MNFIEANGVSLRYAVEGAGKPIVLIHEMGGSMESWSLVAQILAAKRRVVRYDTRGAGFSEKIRGPLTIDTMTDDLIALLDGLGISERVALAGTAVGGAIALHTAFRFPDRVAAAVVTSPATFMPPENRAATLARVDEFERNGVRVAFETTAENGYPEELRGDRHRFEAWRSRWLANDPASFAAVYRMLSNTDLTPRAAVDQMPGAGDRRRVRSRPPAVPRRADRQGHPGRQVQGAAHRPLRGLADAGAGRDGDRGVSGRGGRLNRRPAPQDHARLRGEHAAVAVHHRDVVLLHLPLAAFAAQLAHALDQDEQPVHAGMAVGEPAAIGVHRQLAARARCCRPRRTRRPRLSCRSRGLRGTGSC